MPEYLTPGVYFELRDPAPSVRGVRTDIAGFAGIAERGPIGMPVRIESFRQFQAWYGSFATYGYLAYALKGFFENGGRTCYVVRVAGTDADRASLTLSNAASKPVMRVFGANEGTWARRVAVSIVSTYHAPSPADSTFTLRVTHGNDMELFRDLSVDPSKPTYFATIINAGNEYTPASRWVTVEAWDPAPADMVPSWAGSGLANGSGFLSGGKDGLASLTPNDFLGDMLAAAADRRGMSALALIDEVAMLAMPDIHIRPSIAQVPPPSPPVPPSDPCLNPQPPMPAPPPAAVADQPPLFTEAQVSRMMHAMVEHCEEMRDRFAILDLPLVASSGRSRTVTEAMALRNDFDSPRGFGALYYPWISVVDPIGTSNAPVRTIPPSGHVAGVFARTDNETGVHKAPANAELMWTSDVAVNIGDEEHGLLNPVGVNCIRPFPGRGIRLFGARTISSDSSWRYVNVRRLMMMIEEAVDEASQWAVFEPHNVVLRQGLIRSVGGYLEMLWRSGKLAGASAAEAFFVKCDDTNNPQSSVDQGRVIVDVGVAPAIPAEFIVFRVGRTVEELEIVER
ncbi:MAG: phage tail sheath family protein [Bacteroidetes bacterium]|nr:phage tail sheath family protein [Bacteroidota bacterium]